MCDPLITIAIPTYKRAEQLERCLNALVPQLSERCWLHIADNYSPLPAAEIVEPILLKHLFSNFDIKRHPFNKGAHGNLFHCFETVQTEWVWVLGDDDIPESDAIDKILNLITRETSAFAYVFNVNEFAATSPGECQSKCGRISIPLDFVASNALYCSSLISSAVYKVSAIRSVYPIGHHYSSSFYPHVAWIIACLQSRPEGFLQFCNFPIVKFCNDGYRAECISPILKNLWYLSRMLPSFEEKRALMRSTFMLHFAPKLQLGILNFDFFLIVLAVVYINGLPGQSIVVNTRRRIAEIVEFQSLQHVVPFVALLALSRFFVAWFLGVSTRPLVKIIYQIKCKGGRKYPTILDDRQIKGTS